ncbi:MAG: anti-sigma factor family protein [Methylovirgula sp.]
MGFTSMPIADEDLHSFVDGEVDDDRYEAVLAYLATAPADAARVEAWRQQNILLRAAFAQVTLEQVPVSLSFSFAPRLISLPFAPTSGLTRDAYPRRLWRRSLAFTVAAFIAGVCIALAADFSMKRYSELTKAADGPDLALLATAAMQHSHKADATAQFSQNLPGAIEPALALLPVLKSEGLQLLRGEVRGTSSAPANCLDFADAAGAPVILCIAAADAPADPHFQGLAVVSAHSVYWREATSLYALAAPVAGDRLVALARHIHAALATERKP